MYTKYWNHEDPELKIASLKGLGYILATYPGLFVRAEPIMKYFSSLIFFSDSLSLKNV
jgi:hypothetical protein